METFNKPQLDKLLKDSALLCQACELSVYEAFGPQTSDCPEALVVDLALLRTHIARAARRQQHFRRFIAIGLSAMLAGGAAVYADPQCREALGTWMQKAGQQAVELLFHGSFSADTRYPLIRLQADWLPYGFSLDSANEFRGSSSIFLRSRERDIHSVKAVCYDYPVEQGFWEGESYTEEAGVWKGRDYRLILSDKGQGNVLIVSDAAARLLVIIDLPVSKEELLYFYDHLIVELEK